MHGILYYVNVRYCYLLQAMDTLIGEVFDDVSFDEFEVVRLSETRSKYNSPLSSRSVAALRKVVRSN